MNLLDIDASVGQFGTQQPSRARIFERLGIDYCCGGANPLSVACQDKGLDPQAVLRELTETAENHASDEQRDWSAATMSELADHIESTHHAYLRRELPRLTAMTMKVAAAHGQREPGLRELEAVFAEFRAELESHMEREEQVLFPLIRVLESAKTLPAFHCGSISNPIRVMVHEHENAGSALQRMRALTRGYQPSEEACNTYRAMLDGLAELETDMHLHVHKENNILFREANWAEARLLTKKPARPNAEVGSN